MSWPRFCMASWSNGRPFRRSVAPYGHRIDAELADWASACSVRRPVVPAHCDPAWHMCHPAYAYAGVPSGIDRALGERGESRRSSITFHQLIERLCGPLGRCNGRLPGDGGHQRTGCSGFRFFTSPVRNRISSGFVKPLRSLDAPSCCFLVLDLRLGDSFRRMTGIAGGDRATYGQTATRMGEFSHPGMDGMS